MAVVSNLWITPPSCNRDESAFTDIRRGLVLKRKKHINECFTLCKLWLNSLRKFHHNRLVEFALAKSEITEQNVRDIMPFLEIKQFTSNKSTGSVYVVPEYGEMLDPLLHNWQAPPTIKNRKVKIRLSNTEDFLCVCNLPIDVTEDKFKTFVEKFGSIERSFLVYDDLTDEHKGYGLVEYSSRAEACQAKKLLHKNTLDCNVLFCDWLDHKVVTYCGLYSKCLYIECLPAHFKDLGHLRELFSLFFSPVYCQIGSKNGQSFALVEYDSHESANVTREKLDGCCINYSHIQVHFAVPGRSAIQLYNSFVMESLQEAKTSDGLLPTPRGPLLPLPGIPNLFKPQANFSIPVPKRNEVISNMRNHLLNVPLLQNQMRSLPNMPLISFDASSQLQELFHAQQKQKLMAEIRSRTLIAQRMLSSWEKSKVENAKDKTDQGQLLTKEKENHSASHRIGSPGKVPSSPSAHINLDFLDSPNEEEARFWKNSRGLLETPPTGRPLLEGNLKWKSLPKWTPTRNAEKVPSETVWKGGSPEGLLWPPVRDVIIEEENPIRLNRIIENEEKNDKNSRSKAGILGNAISEGAGLLQMDLENSPTKKPLLSQKTPLLSLQTKTLLLSGQTKMPLLSVQTKTPLLSLHVKKPLIVDEKPLLQDHPKTVLLSDRIKAPHLSDHQKTPLLADQPKMPILSDHAKTPLLDHKKTPLLSDHPKAPLLSDHPKAPLLSDHPKAPLLSDHPKAPLLSDHPKAPLLSDHPKAPLLSDHPKAPLLSDHPKAPLLSDHPKAPLLSDQPKAPLLSVHPKVALLSDHPKAPLLSDHPKAPLLSDQPKPPLLSDHPKTHLLSDHPKAPLLSDHPKAPLLSDHPKAPLLSDHPKAPLLSDHHKAPLLSDQPKPPRLSDHPKAPLLSDHPKAPLLSDHPKAPLLSDHPKAPLLSDHPKAPLLSDHPKAPLLSDHPKAPLLSDHPKAPLLSDHPKVPLLSEHPKTPLLSDHPKTPLISDHPRTPLLLDYPKTPLLLDHPKIPLLANNSHLVDRWERADKVSFLWQEHDEVEIGRKRKVHHLLPTPEASPETGFVGQHSQGIGGHYADSYPKKYRVAQF